MAIPPGTLDQLVAALMAKPAIAFTGPPGPYLGGVLLLHHGYRRLRARGQVGESLQTNGSALGRRWQRRGGDLIQKVQDGGSANRHSAQDWMASHCALRWLEVPDPETRDALEWRLKSVLQPKKTQVLEPELTSVRRHCRCGASVSKPCAPRKRTARQASTSASFEANSAWNALQIEAG